MKQQKEPQRVKRDNHPGNYTPSVLYFHHAAGYTTFSVEPVLLLLLLLHSSLSNPIAFSVTMADSNEDGAH